MGDEVQAIKAGLLEVADLVAVTKADRPGADRAAAHLRAMLTVGAQHDRALGDRPRPKRPEVLLVSAVSGAGVAELMAALDRRSPDTSVARLRRARAQVTGLVAERLRTRLHDAERAPEVESIVREVADHRLDPYAAADRLLAGLEGSR
jgi:LAO/AO transport system kinase